MKSQIVTARVDGAALSIKVVRFPTNGQSARRDAHALEEGLRQSATALAKAGDFRQLSLTSVKVKDFPAAEMEYTLKGTKSDAFSRVTDFDNGQGGYRLHGAIIPYPASARAKADFDAAWERVITTLAPE